MFVTKLDSWMSNVSCACIIFVKLNDTISSVPWLFLEPVTPARRLGIQSHYYSFCCYQKQHLQEPVPLLYPARYNHSDKSFSIAAILDIAFMWKTRCTMDFSQILKHVLKVAVAVIWTIVLPVCYAGSRRKYTCYSTEYDTWLGEWCYSSYMVAVAFYLMTNAVHMVLFLVPAVGRYIETSNCRMCTIFSLWTQVRFLLATTFCITSQIFVSNFNVHFIWGWHITDYNLHYLK